MRRERVNTERKLTSPHSRAIHIWHKSKTSYTGTERSALTNLSHTNGRSYKSIHTGSLAWLLGRSTAQVEKCVQRKHLFHFTVPALNDLLCREQFSVCSTHHFSLRQNPFGWVQSALNRTGLFPRNALYTMLQAESAVQGGLVRRFIQRCAWLAGMPIGLTLSVLAALMQTGATVHVVAEKPVETRRSVRRIPR